MSEEELMNTDDETYEEYEEEAYESPSDLDDGAPYDGSDSYSNIPEEFADIARKYKAHEELSDAEIDHIADTAIEILRALLGFFDASNAVIDEYDGSDGELILDVSNADLAILIGRHGKTLEAFQYLFSLLVNSRLGFRYPIMVDIEGYRMRRRQKLESMAYNAANKALARGCEVRMHPMKPYERRIIHLALRKTENISTHSEGVEPNRYVVIVPSKGEK